MNDVKKTWCARHALDPERLERQLTALRRGLAARGHGLAFLPLSPRKPNEYRYRVQYLYESRDGQRDDYVRGLAELGVELVMDIGSFLILRRRNDGTPFELSPTSTRGSRARSAIFGRAACSRRLLILRRRCAGRRCGTGASSNMPRTLRRRAGSTFHACGRRASLRTLFSVCCGLSWASAFSGSVPLREAAPQAAAGAAYRRIKEARLPRAAFLYAIFTG